jgi:hypothetical protein
MPDKMLPGSPSPAVKEPLDLPALPAHPEWVEISGPWDQLALKVIQDQMVLPGPRDPQEIAAQLAPPEFPVCPVHLVKWVRPELPAPLAHPAPQEPMAPLVPLAPLAPLAPLGHLAKPGPPASPVRRGHLVPPEQSVMSAQQVHQDHLAQLALRVPQETLDRLVQLVQRAQRGR